MPEAWNRKGRALHHDLVDPEREEWIGNISRRERYFLAKWWGIAEKYDHDGLRTLIRRLLHLSASVDGYRSEQLTEAIKGLLMEQRGNPGLHPQSTEDDGKRRGKEGRRGPSGL